jgi:Aromatic acid exporter family member 1
MAHDQAPPSPSTVAPGAVARGLAAARRALTTRGTERDAALLMLKSALATVIAWQFAVRVLHSPSPFYAPMAALLVVDRTMVRSLWASAQRVAAVVVGMSTAWLVGSLVGVHWWSMLPVIYLALLVARWRRLGAHGIQVPSMVLLSLITVGGTNAQFTYLTIVETLIGGVIGVLTNAVVLAPLHIHKPREQIRALTQRVCELLADMSSGLREGWDADAARRWYDVSTELIALAPSIRAEIETGVESTRFNLRDNLRPLEVDWAGYAETVEAVRRGQWQVSGIARTLVDAADEQESQPAPSPQFLEEYAGVLDDVAQALQHFGLADEGERAVVRDCLRHAASTLDRLREKVRTTELDDPRAWPAYGALLLDGQRLIRELEVHGGRAVMPTDSGPIRRPGPDLLGLWSDTEDKPA